MKILDTRGRPVLGNKQAVQQEMSDEGLLEFDEEELALLLDSSDNDDYWGDGYQWDDICDTLKDIQRIDDTNKIPGD